MNPHTTPKPPGAIHHRSPINKFIFCGVAIAIAICTSSCTVNPFVTTNTSGAKIASLGGSIFSKAKWEVGRITNPDGSVIEFGRTGRDEVAGVTSLAKIYATAGVTKALSSDFLQGQKSADLTKRSIVESKAATKQTAITTQGATDQAKIASESATLTTP